MDLQGSIQARNAARHASPRLGCATTVNWVLALAAAVALLVMLLAPGVVRGQEVENPDPPAREFYTYWDDLPAEPAVRTYTAGGRTRYWIAWTADAGYSWASDTPHSTRLSINYYADYGLYEAVDIGAHKTNRHHFSSGDTWFVGATMVLRGKSLYGTQYHKTGYLFI
jgi:hypothetical protein